MLSRISSRIVHQVLVVEFHNIDSTLLSVLVFEEVYTPPVVVVAFPQLSYKMQKP